MSMSAAAMARARTIDKRALLFPVCSGTLVVISIIMQIVALASSYWAHFKRERYPDYMSPERPYRNTEIRQEPAYEEGHYGLWTVCLTVFDGLRLAAEDCSPNIAHFHPSSWRVFAGIIAAVNVVLFMLFLTTIPFQVRHLKTGRPVYCKYKTLTRIKIVLSIVGVTCAVMASVLFGIHSHHKHYKEPKGWSFGLQIIVIVIQVFLLIASSAENVVATRIDQASPGPRYPFTIAGGNKKSEDLRKESFKFPSRNATLASISAGTNNGNNKFARSISGILTPIGVAGVGGVSDEKLNSHATVGREFSRDNPIFIDSDNEYSLQDRSGMPGDISVIDVPPVIVIDRSPGDELHDRAPSRSRSADAAATFGGVASTAVGRFRVEKIADMYTSSESDVSLGESSSSAGKEFAYDNAAYCKDSDESLNTSTAR